MVSFPLVISTIVTLEQYPVSMDSLGVESMGGR